MAKMLTANVIVIIALKCGIAGIYAMMIYMLIKVRPKSSTFRSSFYSFFLMQSIADFTMFFYMELMYRPRMYNYFDWFNKDMDNLAQWSYLLLFGIRATVTIGQGVIAFNRFTIFRFPGAHVKMWSDRVVILTGIAVWVVGFSFVLPLWLIFKNELKFREASDGTIQLSGGQFSVYQLYPTNAVNLAAVFSCAYFYGYSIYKSPSLPSKKRAIERRLLICAVVSSLPFLFGFIRVCLVYFGRINQSEGLVNFAIYVWTYEEPANFVVQPIVQLCINKSFRDLMLKRGTNSTDTTVMSVAPRSRVQTF